MKIETRHRDEAIRIGQEARSLFFLHNPNAQLSAKAAGYIREQMEMALADAEEKGSRGFIGPAPAQPSASEGERVEQVESSLQRMSDLVRYARHFLHNEGLISDDEYAELVQMKGAVSRLEGYERAVARLVPTKGGADHEPR